MWWEALFTGVGAILLTITAILIVGGTVLFWWNRKID
jgi:hypothetical protein